MITLYHGTSSKRASKIVGNDKHVQQGFKVQDYDCIFLAEDLATARFFAAERVVEAEAYAMNMNNLETPPKNISVIEFQIPIEVATELGLSDADRKPLGVFTGMAFPDIAQGSGFERILESNQRIAKFNELLASKIIQHRRLRFDRKPTSHAEGAC